MFLHTTCVSGVWGGLKWIPNPLELELQMVVSCHGGGLGEILRFELGPLKELQVLLSAMPHLQPCH